MWPRKSRSWWGRGGWTGPHLSTTSAPAESCGESTDEPVCLHHRPSGQNRCESLFILKHNACQFGFKLAFKEGLSALPSEAKISLRRIKSCLWWFTSVCVIFSVNGRKHYKQKLMSSLVLDDAGCSSCPKQYLTRSWRPLVVKIRTHPLSRHLLWYLSVVLPRYSLVNSPSACVWFELWPDCPLCWDWLGRYIYTFLLVNPLTPTYTHQIQVEGESLLSSL